jgi:hypothetical protein
MILIVIVILFTLIIFSKQTNKIEHFNLFNEIEQKEFKEDKYMNFLVNLNDNLQIKLKHINKDDKTGLKLCNDKVQNELKTKVSDLTFKKVPISLPQGHLLDTQITNDTIGIPFDPSEHIKNIDCSSYREHSDSCLYKGITLSEQINPFMYITSPNTRFPARCIFKPYKNSELPHHINISRHKFLYNCCNNGTV